MQRSEIELLGNVIKITECPQNVTYEATIKIGTEEIMLRKVARSLENAFPSINYI